MMKKFSLIMLILVAPLLLISSAKADYSAIYTSYIDYDGGNKIGGSSLTGYYSVGDVSERCSFGISATSIEYKDNYTSSILFKKYGISNVGIRFLNQVDFTVVDSITNKLIKNHTFSFGLHYISTDDNLTDNGVILYFDGTYFRTYNWNVGLESTFSYYPESINLKVFQVSPHIGKYFLSSLGTFYVGGKFYFIDLDKESELGLDNSHFSSEELFLYFYEKSFDLGISVWKGKQVFAVKDGGFVVYNLAEEYKGGMSFKGGYSFNKNYKLITTLSVNEFEDLETGDDVTQTAVTVSLGYKW